MPQAADLGDLMATTLRYLNPLKITDISTELSEYVVTSQFVNRKQPRVKIDSGTEVQWDVMTNFGGNARFTELYATDVVNVTDSMIQAQLPWRWAETSYAIDEREVDMNGSPAKIVDLMSTRRLRSLVAYAALIEDAFWSFPTTTETKKPHGIDYWIVKNATTGFNGGAQSGYTTVANINPTVYTRWRNYTALYTNMTKDDGIDKIRTALSQVNWIRPVNDGPGLIETAKDQMMFANLTTVQTMENLAESQNDNLGKDLNSTYGQVTIRRVPIVRVPKLDADTTNPVYGVDFGTFKMAVLRNRWLKEKRIDRVPGQRNVMAVFYDSGFNWICFNRRRNFVVANSASYVN